MYKKVFFVLLLATLILSACGGAATTATQAPAGEQPAGDQTGSEPVELKVMMWGATEELAVWQQLADDFHAQNPNITVTMDVSDWTSYWEKVNTMYAGGTPPDVFAMDAPLFQDWYTRDTLLDLQPYIDAEPGLLDGLYPQPLQAYNVDGHYYGLPRDCQTIALFYNKDMFDAAGIAYPDDTWTYDTLREVSLQLTKDTDGDGNIDQWGFSTDLWDMELFWSSAIWAYGGEVISADHTETLLTEGAARDAWQLISDMMVTDKSMPNPDEIAQYGSDGFDAGVAAMTTIGHWAVPTYATREFAWDVAPMPAGPAGRATSVNSAGFVVAKNAAHPDEAFQFIQFVISQTGQTRLAEMGLSVPVLKSVAESPVYLDQSSAPINHQVFVDAIEYAHMKPVFRGYDMWASVVGDTLIPVWLGQTDINAALDEIKPAADEVLAQNK